MTRGGDEVCSRIVKNRARQRMTSSIIKEASIKDGTSIAINTIPSIYEKFIVVGIIS